MKQAIAALFLAIIGMSAKSANAETRYEFEYRNLYDVGWQLEGTGFSGYFTASDSNGDGSYDQNEVTEFVINGIYGSTHFVGPKSTCDACYLWLDYTPGGWLVFSSYAKYYYSNEFVYEFESYNNNEMTWGLEPAYSRRLEVGPDSIVTITQIPEPSTYGMLLGGLGVLGLLARRRKV